MKVRTGVNSWCSSFRKRPDMLAGPVALFGFKADKRRFIPLWCISIYLRSGNGVHVSSSCKLVAKNVGLFQTTTMIVPALIDNGATPVESHLLLFMNDHKRLGFELMSLFNIVPT